MTSDVNAAPAPGARQAPKRRTPLYKRRRRRRYALVIAVLVVIAGVSAGLSLADAGASAFTISTSQGAVANSDSIIESNPALARTVPAKLKFIPFESGVTAVAEMRSGTIASISGVGNPPAVEAIGDNTGITVVMAQSFDSDALLVPANITTPAQLAGKSIGVLVGSSEDFELHGWLALEHLTGKVKLVEMGSEQAVGAAYVAHAVDAAYVQGGFVSGVRAKGTHSLTDAEKIAKLGVPGIDAVAVSSSLIQSNPNLVQKYVCAEVQGTKDLTGPQSSKYLAQSAGVQGVAASAIIPATKAYPFIPLNQQLYWLGGSPNDPKAPIVKAYQQTAQYLIQQGRLQSTPSASTIAAHVDPTFIKKAVAGDC